MIPVIAVLAMLLGVWCIGAPSRAGTGPSAEASRAETASTSAGALAIVKKHGRFVVSCPQSALTLEIPAASELQPMDMRALNGPRYFYFVGQAGLSLSGWFEPSGKYNGLQEFWRSASARFYASPVTSPRDVLFEKSGDWDVILYDLDLPHGATSVNLSAEFAQAGTWIDLHMSVGVRKEESPAVRKRLRQVLGGIRTSVSKRAAPTHEEVISAVLDLTDRIGVVDDRGYEKALAVVDRYVGTLPREAFAFNADACPWRSEQAADPSAVTVLDIAFLATVLKDELSGKKDDVLYDAWLIVIKYYEHYRQTPTGSGGQAWRTIPAIEELIMRGKGGQLQAYARSVVLRKQQPGPSRESMPETAR